MPSILRVQPGTQFICPIVLNGISYFIAPVGNHSTWLGLFDLAGNCVNCYQGSQSIITCCSTYVKDEQTFIVAGCEDGTVHIYNAHHGEYLQKLQCLPTRIPSLAAHIALDGAVYIIIGSYTGEIIVWNANTKNIVRRIQAHNSVVIRILAYNGPDKCARIISAGDNRVRMWDIKSGAHLATFSGHTGQVLDVALFNDNDGKTKLVSCSADRTVRLWSISTGKIIYTFQSHDTEVNRVVLYRTINNAFRIISCDLYNKVLIWNPLDGALISTLNTIAILGASISQDIGIVTAENNMPQLIIASTSIDSSIITWNLNTNTLIRTINLHNNLHRIYHATTYKNAAQRNYIVSIGHYPSNNFNLRIYDANTGGWLNSIAVDPEAKSVITYTQNIMQENIATLIAIGGDNSIKLYNSEIELMNIPLIGQGPIIGLEPITQNGEVYIAFLSLYNRNIGLCNAATGQVVWLAEDFYICMTSYRYTNAEGVIKTNIVAANNTKTIKILDAETGTLIKEFEEMHTEAHTEWHLKKISQLSIFIVLKSPTIRETKIVSGSLDKTIQILDAKTGEKIKINTEYSIDRILTMEVNNQAYIVSTGVGILEVYNATTQIRVRTECLPGKCVGLNIINSKLIASMDSGSHLSFNLNVIISSAKTTLPELRSLQQLAASAYLKNNLALNEVPPHLMRHLLAVVSPLKIINAPAPPPTAGPALQQD